jgi:serine/threonine protein kinase
VTGSKRPLPTDGNEPGPEQERRVAGGAPPAKRTRFTLPDGTCIDGDALADPPAAASGATSELAAATRASSTGSSGGSVTVDGAAAAAGADMTRERRRALQSPPAVIARSMTKHVVTRYYRAPELILLQEYGLGVDVWSAGCILAELLSMDAASVPRFHDRKPLFPGRTCFPLSADRPSDYADRMDQLNVIFDVLGTPSAEDVAAMEPTVRPYLSRLRPKEPQSLQHKLPGAPPEAIDLLYKVRGEEARPAACAAETAAPSAAVSTGTAAQWVPSRPRPPRRACPARQR